MLWLEFVWFFWNQDILRVRCYSIIFFSFDWIKIKSAEAKRDLFDFKFRIDFRSQQTQTEVPFRLFIFFSYNLSSSATTSCIHFYCSLVTVHCAFLFRQPHFCAFIIFICSLATVRCAFIFFRKLFCQIICHSLCALFFVLRFCDTLSSFEN